MQKSIYLHEDFLIIIDYESVFMNEIATQAEVKIKDYNIPSISFDELVEKYQYFSKRYFLINIKFGIVSNQDRSDVQCLMVSLDDFKQYFLDLPENQGFSMSQETETDSEHKLLSYQCNWAILFQHQYFNGELPLSENDAWSLLDRLDEVYVYYINDGLPETMDELDRRVAILFT